MKRTGWKKRITQACLAAGTYRDYFMPVIDTLADILAQRDEAMRQYKLDGQKPIVTHVNKAGSEYQEQNPLLRLINDLNRDALAYWRDLGLTPAGLKRIDEQSMKQKKRSVLAEALAELGG